MRLCIVAPGRPRFLAYGTYVEALVPHFRATAGIDEVVVLSDLLATQERMALKPAWNPDSAFVAAQQIRAIEAERPDVVWFQTGLMLGSRAMPNLARISVPALVRQRGTPTVVTLHNLLEGGPLRPLGLGSSVFHRAAGRLATRLSLKATRVCFTLQRYVELVGRCYGASNAAHIPHHTFGPVSYQPARRESARFLCFGSLAPFKGIDTLIEAHSRVSARLPYSQLCVAGGLHHRYPDFATSRRNSDAIDGRCIRWLGEVSDRSIDRLMTWCDVVVVPNIASTGSSSVMHRAAAHGKPVIASDLPDFRAVAEEEGLHVAFAPPGDSAALSDLMLRLATDVQLRERAGQTNAASAEQLTPACIARRYLHIFEAALAADSSRVETALPALPLTAEASPSIG